MIKNILYILWRADNGAEFEHNAVYQLENHWVQNEPNHTVPVSGQLGVRTGTFNHSRHASQRHASHAQLDTPKKQNAKTRIAFGQLPGAKEFGYSKPKLAKTGYVYRRTRDAVPHTREAKTLEPVQTRENARDTTTSWRSKRIQDVWAKPSSRRSYPLLRSIARIPTPPDAVGWGAVYAGCRRSPLRVVVQKD